MASFDVCLTAFTPARRLLTKLLSIPLAVMPLPHLEHEALSENVDDEALQDQVILLDSDAVIPETQFDGPLSHHFNRNGRDETPLSPSSAVIIRDLSINSSQATSLTNASFSKSLSLLKRPASAEDDPVITFKFTIPKRPRTNISGGPSDPHSASQGDRGPSKSHQSLVSVTKPSIVS